MEGKHIAFLTPGSFPVPSSKSSSVEHVVAEIAEELGHHVRCTVFGIKTGYQPRRETRGAVRYIRPCGRKGYVRAVIKHLKRGNYDVVQVENRPRYVRALKRALPNVPVWLYLHSLTFVSPKRIRRKELTDCLLRADRILVNSEFLKEEIAKLVPSAASRIDINYLGVNQEQFTSRWTNMGDQLRREKLRDLGFEGRKIILYVGRLMRMKGVHHLLRALPNIIAKEPEALLIIVGGAFYGSKRKTAYVRKLHAMGRRLKRHVKFIPYVPHTRIQEWFRIADVVVVPSSNREAFGLVNVEAMATGVPVVATRAGGMKEIVVDGVTGFLIDPDQVMKELEETVTALLSDEHLRRIMGEASAARVNEMFTWQETASRWLSLFQWQTFDDSSPSPTEPERFWVGD